MPYTPLNWENLPSQNTPINSTNLNHMEQGLFSVTQTADANKALLDSSVPRSDTVLGTEDLNTILRPGTYHQTNAANATISRNYPLEGHPGTLEVIFAGNTGSGGVDKRRIHVFTVTTFPSRAKISLTRYSPNGTTWDPWTTTTTGWVQQGAPSQGRSVKQWSYPLGANQMIYGDTGTWDITSTMTKLDSGSVSIRRTDFFVALSFIDCKYSGTGSFMMGATPTGYVPSGAGQKFFVRNITGDSYVRVEGSGIFVHDYTSNEPINAHIIYPTNSVFPAPMTGTLISEAPVG